MSRFLFGVSVFLLSQNQRSLFFSYAWLQHPKVGILKISPLSSEHSLLAVSPNSYGSQLIRGLPSMVPEPPNRISHVGIRLIHWIGVISVPSRETAAVQLDTAVKQVWGALVAAFSLCCHGRFALRSRWAAVSSLKECVGLPMSR